MTHMESNRGSGDFAPEALAQEEILLKQATALIADANLASHNFSKADIVSSVREIASRLPPQEFSHFVQHTLPSSIHEGRLKNASIPEDTAAGLLRSADSGTLTHTLPLILDAFPNVQLLLLEARLAAMVESVTPAQREETFNSIVPQLIAGYEGKFSHADLYGLQALFQTAREDAPLLCALIQHRLIAAVEPKPPFIEVIHLIGDVERLAGRRLLVQCLEFCGDVIERVGLAGVSRDWRWVDLLVRGAAQTWTCWQGTSNESSAQACRSGGRDGCAPAMLALLEGVYGRASDAEALGLLAQLRIPSVRAAPILTESLAVAKLGMGELHEHLCCVMDWEKQFHSSHLSALTQLFASGAEAGRKSSIQAVLAAIRETCGHGRIETCFRFLGDALNAERINEVQLSALITALPELRTAMRTAIKGGQPLSFNSLTHLAVGLLINGEPTNPWPITEAEVRKRWRSFRAISRPTPLKMPNFDRFVIDVTPPGEEVRLRRDTQLTRADRDFVNKRRYLFSAPDNIGRARIFHDILKRLEEGQAQCRTSRPVPRTSSQSPDEVLRLLVYASELDGALGSERKKFFTSVAKMSFPLLASATHMDLLYLDGEHETANSYYSFLESFRVFVDDRLPVTLENCRMKRPYIDHLKQVAGLPLIEAQMSKFEKSQPSLRRTVRFTFFDNVLDAFYDQLAVTCILEKASNDLEKRSFMPLSMVDDDSLSVLGCWYLVIGRVHGARALILAGGGPRESLSKSTNVTVLTDRTITFMKALAHENKLDGLYQAVGMPDPASGLAWTDEGRIAQHKDVRRAIMSRTRQIIDLPARQHIRFPSGYSKGPIRRVAEIWRNTP